MRNLKEYANLCIENLNNIGIYPNKVTKFEINTRAKHRWGQTRYDRTWGEYYININSILLDEKVDEKSLLNTLYHELLHCVDGCFNHGEKWQRLADLVNDCYNMDISRCTDAKTKLGEMADDYDTRKTFSCECLECGMIHTKKGYRQPKWYAHPQYFSCKCGGALARI